MSFNIGVSSFQEVRRIERFHYMQVSSFHRDWNRGVLISGGWNRGEPLYSMQRCPHLGGWEGEGGGGGGWNRGVPWTTV